MNLSPTYDEFIILKGWVPSKDPEQTTTFVLEPARPKILPSAYPAYRWDTKRKLFSLVEVCTLPSAVPANSCNSVPQLGLLSTIRVTQCCLGGASEKQESPQD